MPDGREAAISKATVLLSRRKRGPRGFQYTHDQIAELIAVLRETGEVWETGYNYDTKQFADAATGLKLRVHADA